MDDLFLFGEDEVFYTAGYSRLCAAEMLLEELYRAWIMRLGIYACFSRIEYIYCSEQMYIKFVSSFTTCTM